MDIKKQGVIGGRRLAGECLPAASPNGLAAAARRAANAAPL